MKRLFLLFASICIFNFLVAQKNYEILYLNEFQNISSFSDGLAKVIKNGESGYIDKKGNLVIDYQPYYGGDFSEGLALISKDGKYGFIDKSGNVVIDYSFGAIQGLSKIAFSEGLVTLIKHDKKNYYAGYIDKKGGVVIDYQYTLARPFIEGLAAVSNKNGWGYIDKTGRTVIDFQYKWGFDFSEGLAGVKKKEKYGYIDKTGNLIIEHKYDEAGPFSKEGLAAVKEGELWGYIDRTGKVVIDFKYSKAGDFSEGLAAVTLDGGYRMGYIDPSGNMVIDNKFMEAKAFSEGLAAVKGNYKWGYINREGDTIIDFQFSKTENFSEGFARVEINNSLGMVRYVTLKNRVEEYVEDNIKEWQQKGKYETTEQYQQRVTSENRNKKIHELTDQVLEELAGKRVMWDEITSEYDADNQTFKINIKGLDSFYVNVPVSDAEAFDKNISTLQFSNQRYTLSDEKSMALLHASITNPSNGKKYLFDSKQVHAFNTAQLDLNFGEVDINMEKNTSTKEGTTIIKAGQSDVDIAIPKRNTENKNAFALIIGNENYSNEISVPYAHNDASIFSEYAKKTLGIPESQVHLLKDATFGQMISELEWLKEVLKAYKGEAKVYFYYAGHGVPDQVTKGAYLLPVDGISSNTRTSISLDELYKTLTEYPSEKVTVFLDACFSGAAREGTLAEGRAVKIKPKENILKGNMIVFSAVTGDETAHPYDEKGHGLFTYYLLKKLQETKGDVTYKELIDFVTENVRKKSVVQQKPQNPVVNVSSSQGEGWKTKKLY